MNRYPLLVLFLLSFACGKTPSRATWTEAVSFKNQGVAYLDRNDFDSALKAFEAVIRLVPDEPLGYANLAAAYLGRQEPEKAMKPIGQALKLSPKDGQILAIQADIILARGDQDDALTILKAAVDANPTDLMARYKYLTLISRARAPGQVQQEVIGHLRAILDQDPDNLAVLAQLAETLVRSGDRAAATPTYERMEPFLTAASVDARSYLRTTIESLRSGPVADAQRNAMILGNLLKADPSYRDSRDLLGDVTQESPPLQDFRTAPPDLASNAADALINLTFTAAAMFASPPGPASSVTSVDYDTDGYPDAAVIKDGKIQMVHNDSSSFVDAQTGADINSIDDAIRLFFGDLDNDGDLDLVVPGRNQTTILWNRGADGFVANQATTWPVQTGRSAVGTAIVDYDHDGDLDVVISDASGISILRNVEPQRFEKLPFPFDAGALSPEVTPAAVKSYSVVCADFDQDGALDLVFSRPDGTRLFHNERQGRFSDWSQRFGTQPITASQVAVVGDFNNDGIPDLFMGGARPSILWNERGARFDGSVTPQSVLNACKDLAITGAVALDFDNDGFLDVAASGIPTGTATGIRLIRNLGSGRFEDASSTLPSAETVGICLSLAAGDVDNDGDVDLIASTDSGTRFFRNEGGNANHWLTVRLEAALTGSGKNNTYGVGSTIDVNSKTHFQSLLVTEPITHIGIGKAAHADVYRVLWSNGTIQNTVNPPANSLVVEKQRLKGSCPSLYTWNGEKYVFVTHLMTRSAIGALTEMGTPAYPDAADDYVKISGDQLQVKDGKYTLNVVEELWDAVYMDQMALIVVDHPESSDVFVDEKYLPPPYPAFTLYTATHPRLPVAAVDQRGRDVLKSLVARDTLYAGDYALGRYQGVPETHSITLDLGDLSKARTVRLYLGGWIMPIEPSSNLALSQQKERLVAPYLEVPDAQGKWRTVIPYTGFPSGEHKTMVIDLTDKFLTRDYRVRITTNLQLYWSEAFFTVDEPKALPVKMTRLKPATANLRYRGFSREYQVAPNGPYLRDYGNVSAAPQWLPFIGYRTRYGDVARLLEASDDQYAVYSSGEEIAVTFDAEGLPALPTGWRRDYVLHSDGWLKEGDLNTDTAATVEPLPFHGMSRYPYGTMERYPVDEARQAYLDSYHTRWVSQRAFRDQIRWYGDALGKRGSR